MWLPNGSQVGTSVRATPLFHIRSKINRAAGLFLFCFEVRARFMTMTLAVAYSGVANT